MYAFWAEVHGYLFGQPCGCRLPGSAVLDEQGYPDAAAQGEELFKRIEFVSPLQDMKAPSISAASTTSCAT